MVELVDVGVVVVVGSERLNPSHGSRGGLKSCRNPINGRARNPFYLTAFTHFLLISYTTRIQPVVDPRLPSMCLQLFDAGLRQYSWYRFFTET